MTQYLLSVWGTHSQTGTGPYAGEGAMRAAFEQVAAFNEGLVASGRDGLRLRAGGPRDRLRRVCR